MNSKPSNAGKGRVKGVPNIATKNARLAIAAFIEQNTERVNHLVDEIEKREGPRAAFECLMRLIEHHMPKLRLVKKTSEPRSQN